MMGRGLLLVAMIALALLIVDFAREEADDALGASNGADATGYYLRGARVTEYGEDGDVDILVTAASAVEIPARGEVLMNGVSVEYFALPGQRWALTAQTGRIPAGFRQVELEGDVVMRGERDGEPHEAVIETDRLTLDTETERARTDAPVALAFGQYRLGAVGLEADLTAETLRLESAVHGSFVR